MAEVTIRIAKPSDARAIKKVNYEGWLVAHPNEELGITLEKIKERLTKNMTEEKIKSFADTLLDKDQRTFIAQVDNEIVGYCTVRKGESINKLEAIYILPSYFGKNVGKSLIEKGLEWLGNKKEIEIEVASYNERAIKFYEKHGFKPNGRMGDSSGIPTIFLTREL